MPWYALPACEKMQLETKLWWYHYVPQIKLPHDINFHWNPTKLTFSIFQPFWKKNGWLEIKYHSTIMFAASNYPKISIFIEIGQSLHFCHLAAILKKNGGSKIKFDCTIMSTISKTTYSNLNYLSSYYTFWDIKCHSWKMRKKRHKKVNNSNTVSWIGTKIAQQIDLVVLNNLRCLGILITAFVFELLNVKVEKFRKTT